MLSDGSTVMLNVDSQLRLPTSFGQKTRVVYLRGEAYFEVAFDANRPFIIHTEGAVVQVLGTAFGVKAYPKSGAVRVVVKEGSVSLKLEGAGQQSEVTLQMGQLGRVASSGGHVTTKRVDPSNYLAWTKGRLVFRNASLHEVTRRIERWYGVSVNVGKSLTLRGLRLTASLESQSVQHVLGVITTTLGISYRIKGDSTFVLLRNTGAR